MTNDERNYIQTLLWGLKDELGLSTVREAGEDLLNHYNAFKPETVRLVEEFLNEESENA